MGNLARGGDGALGRFPGAVGPTGAHLHMNIRSVV